MDSAVIRYPWEVLSGVRVDLELLDFAWLARIVRGCVMK